ncbi:MAG: pyridoxamine 5'-phosphate oxidase family protein [Clostridiaceae bacterium]
MSFNENQINDYLNNSKTLVLATVGDENKPELRTLGGYGVKNDVIYFSTGKGSNKVKQLEINPEVSVLFQHENQVIPNFINITVNGVAEELKDSEDFNRALEVIKQRRPQLNATEETHKIYAVKPSLIKILDFTKEAPEERVKIIEVKWH